MPPLAWILLIPLLQPQPADESLASHHSPIPSVGLLQLEQGLLSNIQIGASIPGEFFVQRSNLSFIDNDRFSRWSYSLGKHLYRSQQGREWSPIADDFGECIRSVPHLPRFGNIDWIPADVSFGNVPSDPLLHAPPWWTNPANCSRFVDSESRAPTLSFWMCDPKLELGRWADELPRIGIGLTLDLRVDSVTSPWGCRLTGNFDDHGEMGVLLQFCWH
ncbi:MAG: hypothetical protein CBC13_02460 [Planctomycetia bacterium TMED53]|nr:MAG: hypothetical protein CBC13_02460 [Planctomycetia bacterium TMED53]